MYICDNCGDEFDWRPYEDTCCCCYLCYRKLLAQSFKVGDRVSGGTPGTDDYDTGTVLDIDGDQITVGWDSGVQTTQSADQLTK